MKYFSLLFVLLLACSANAQQVTIGPSPFALLSTQTASASATLDFTGLDSSLDPYTIQCTGLVPANNGASLWLRYGQGATPTWLATGYAYTVQGSLGSGAGVATIEAGGAGVAVVLSRTGVWNGAGTGINTTVTFSANPAAGRRVSNFQSGYADVTATAHAQSSGSGTYTSDTTAITALRVMFSAGNITSGTCKLYGAR